MLRELAAPGASRALGSFQAGRRPQNASVVGKLWGHPKSGRVSKVWQPQARGELGLVCSLRRQLPQCQEPQGVLLPGARPQPRGLGVAVSPQAPGSPPGRSLAGHGPGAGFLAALGEFPCSECREEAARARCCPAAFAGRAPPARYCSIPLDETRLGWNLWLCQHLTTPVVELTPRQRGSVCPQALLLPRAGF